MSALSQTRIVGLVKPCRTAAETEATLADDSTSAGESNDRTAFIYSVNEPTKDTSVLPLPSDKIKVFARDNHTETDLVQPPSRFVELVTFSLSPFDNEFEDTKLYKLFVDLPDAGVPILFEHDQSKLTPLFAIGYDCIDESVRASPQTSKDGTCFTHLHSKENGDEQAAPLKPSAEPISTRDRIPKLERITPKQRKYLLKQTKLTLAAQKLFPLCESHKCAEFVALLEVTEVPIDIRDPQGNTFLHIAAKQNSIVLVKECLRRGANLNAQNNLGKTALHVACKLNFRDMADLLTDKGADDSIVDNNNATCYEES
eukprot:gene8284-9852_t